MHGLEHDYGTFENVIRCFLIIDFLNDFLSDDKVSRLNVELKFFEQGFSIMKHSYEKILQERYLKHVKIENKEYYYSLIYEISESLTWEIAVDFHSNKINMIITEAGQSLVNSIKLYELDYFDDAYYSMRSAIELAKIMLDVGDNEYEKMVHNMNLFSTKEYKKFQIITLRYLKDNRIEFRNATYKMPNFVKEVNDICIKLNKFVHKIGFDNYLVILSTAL